MLLNLQDYIDLENTLFSGQCFRWQKKGSWYLGVLKGNVLKVRLRGTSLEYFSYPDSESDIEAVVNNYFRLSDDIKKTKKANIKYLADRSRFFICKKIVKSIDGTTKIVPRIAKFKEMEKGILKDLEELEAMLKK